MNNLLVIAFLLVLNAPGELVAQNAPKRTSYNPEAVKLNNRAMALAIFISDPDSCRRGLVLLDQATSIDSNYFTGYSNKLMFYAQLQEFVEGAKTADKLVSLRPRAHDLYLTGAVFHAKAGHDKTAIEYLEKSLSICKAVMDTMNADNPNFETLSLHSAIALKLLGRGRESKAQFEKMIKAREVHRALYVLPADYLKTLLKKTRAGLLDFMIDPPQEENISVEATKG
jgi:tetratricopeptide (TPR) repeat protein